jgi:hypothetical protein
MPRRKNTGISARPATIGSRPKRPTTKYVQYEPNTMIAGCATLGTSSSPKDTDRPMLTAA